MYMLVLLSEVMVLPTNKDEEASVTGSLGVTEAGIIGFLGVTGSDVTQALEGHTCRSGS